VFHLSVVLAERDVVGRGLDAEEQCSSTRPGSSVMAPRVAGGVGCYSRRALRRRCRARPGPQRANASR
jgi:hypothetical protein